MFRRRLAVVDKQLGDGRPYLTGERLTIADISVGYALGLGGMFGLDADYSPKVKDYFSRLQARPAFQAAATK